jgi:transcriptional regulator with XRE-family HTH domain
MVLPSPGSLLRSALGLGDIRAALRLMQSPLSEGGFGLGLSRRAIARSLGVNESTLRGIEREGAKPRQSTIDNVVSRLQQSELVIAKGTDKRTRSDTLTMPGVSRTFYKPRIPENAVAFRLVTRNPPGSRYPFDTQTAKDTNLFNVLDEIAYWEDQGLEVTRVVWDTGDGMRIQR